MKTWTDKIDNAQGLIYALRDFASLHPAQLHSLQAQLHYGDELGEAIQDLHECWVELRETSRRELQGRETPPIREPAQAAREPRAGG